MEKIPLSGMTPGSSLGCLKELLGERGTISIGIIDNALMEDVLVHHRKRRHRLEVLMLLKMR